MIDISSVFKISYRPCAIGFILLLRDRITSYNVCYTKLLRNINGDGLVVGNLLLIPKTSQAGGTNQANLFINHTVKKGETLFAISREYNVDIDVITKVNPTTNLSNLKKGEVIQIPNSLWFAKNYNLQDNVNTPAPAKDNTSTTALKENCDGFKGKNSNLSIP